MFIGNKHNKTNNPKIKENYLKKNIEHFMHFFYFDSFGNKFYSSDLNQHKTRKMSEKTVCKAYIRWRAHVFAVENS